MSKILIFGNSGSGKSTLAKKISVDNDIAHLDLDTIAWQSASPPTRTPISESMIHINNFLNEHNYWVVEGCYSDLLQEMLKHADKIIFLNLSVEDCILNAESRPWEPHKYESKEAQDANLAMLVDWISQYPDRLDTFSLQAHLELYNKFDGIKEIRTSNM